MSKYYGKVGYLETKETVPGVWTEEIIERPYTGDITQLSRSRQPDSSQLNDNVNMNIQISILADPYAYANLASMRYITWMGTAWKITSITPEYPRLSLTIGGVYNAPQAEAAE